MSASWKGKKLATTVGSAAALTTIDTIRIKDGATNLWLEVGNSAHKELDAFELAIRPHSDAEFHVIGNATSDFTNVIQPPIKGCDQNMTVLPKSTTGLIWMTPLKGIYEIRIRGSSGAGSDTTIDTKWQQR